MQITYDPRHNVAYIALADKAEKVETLRISDELNIDIGTGGKVYGIELLNANEQLQKDKNTPITIVNEALGKVQEVVWS